MKREREKSGEAINFHSFQILFKQFIAFELYSFSWAVFNLLTFCFGAFCGFALAACRTQNRINLLQSDHWHCSSLSVWPPWTVYPVTCSLLLCWHLHLCTPNRRKRFQGQCAFSFTAPSVWNNLPFSLWHAQTLSAFRSQLKAHLFPVSYSCWFKLCWTV